MSAKEITGGSKGLLGFWGLAAVVFGSIIGSSIFSVPQNIAKGASAGNAMLAWIFSGIGILLLVLVLKRLSDTRSDLKAGVYQYAQEGFGPFIGFNTAWGYWICVLLGNVALIVMLCDTIGAFIPAVSGKAWFTLAFGLTVIWGMCLVVCRGIDWAAKFNTFLSVLKFGSILLMVVILAFGFKSGLLEQGFHWDWSVSGISDAASQVNSCMLVTVWSFMGIEGAVMMAARAKRQKDVGKATVTAFVLALALYVLVSLACYGVLSQKDLASLPTPSAAFVMERAAGSWAKWAVLAAVAVSLCGGFVAWTLICAQVPQEAAECGIFPRRFKSVNSKGMPTYGLIVSSIVMSLCLMIVIWADNVYLAALNLTSMMVLPTYLFASLYLLKLAIRPWGKEVKSSTHFRKTDILLGAGSVIFCVYIMAATSLELMLATSGFYLAGTGVFLKSRRERGASAGHLLNRKQRVVLGLLGAMTIAAIWMMSTGHLKLDSV